MTLQDNDSGNLEELIVWCQNNDAGIKLRHMRNNRWRLLIMLFPRALKEEIIFERYSVSLSTLIEAGVERVRLQDKARETPGFSDRNAAEKRGWG